MASAFLREQHRFPTREFPVGAVNVAEAGVDDVAGGTAPPAPSLEPARVHRMVLGIDPGPTPMDAEELARELRDPFAELLLKRGVFPQSLRELLRALDAQNGAPQGLPVQDSFVVGDGGQIPWTEETAGLNRGLRLVVTRSRGSELELMVSASTVIDSDRQFLQVMAWDPDNAVFHYYQRVNGAWVWAGNSWHALDPRSRGRGPFDSHVNGSLVMKELLAPWLHWSSERARIGGEVLDPADPLRNEPLFRDHTGAQKLELGVKAGIARWTRARLAATHAPGGTVEQVPFLMRQVLETTTVNLRTADVPSRQVRAGRPLRIPLTFFLNQEALLNVIGLAPDVFPFDVDGGLYLGSLQRFGVELRTDGFSQPGDVFFAFPFPEPAFEDRAVLEQLLQRGILDDRFAAALLMVDFPNPVFSPRRAALMRYVPDTAHVGPNGSDLPARFVAAVEEAAAGLPADSPEREFLTHWSVPEDAWRAAHEARLVAYFRAAAARAATREGWFDAVRLAESRRREFRKRPLAEFHLTLPVATGIPADAPLLEMASDGTVRPKAVLP
jgi:hypothetical protein